MSATNDIRTSHAPSIWLSRCISGILATAALLAGPTLQPAGAQMPTIGAGILEAPDAMLPSGQRVWLWQPDGVYLPDAAMPALTLEITDPAGLPIFNTRAMLAAPDSSNPSGSSVWIWTDDRVLLHVFGSTTTVEITDTNVNPLAGVRGMIATPDASSISGSSVWLWNGSGAYRHQFASTQAVRLSDSTGLDITNVRGMAGTPDGASPSGTSVWLWNDAATYLQQFGTTQAVEITAPNGNPLAGVRGMLGTPKTTSPSGTGVWFWNGAGVFLHQFGSTTTSEITGPGPSSLTDTRGMVGIPDSSNPSGTSVWMWNPGGTYLHTFGTTQAVEITDPNTNPLAGVRGILGTPDTSGVGPGSDVWIWTGAGVFLHQFTTTTTAEITLPGDVSLQDVRGLLGAVDGTSVTGHSVWLWNAAGAFLHQTGTQNVVEITDPNINPLANLRGMSATPDPGSPTGSAVWLWNGAGMYLHLLATTTAAPLTDIPGNPILDPWCLIQVGDGVWLRTQTDTFVYLNGTLMADYIFDPVGNPLPSPFYGAPLVGLAMVHNTLTPGGGGEGAGRSPERPLLGVDFFGSSVDGAVDASTAPVLPGLSTVLAADGVQAARQAGVSLSNDHVAVVLSFKEVPGFGACCDAGACTEGPLADCQAQGGIYQGDGSACLGDLNGDGFDEACQAICEPGQYRLDDGHGDVNIGVTHGPGADVHTLAWLNRYQVELGMETITHIRVAFGNVPPGLPVDVYIWDDPNQDGDPSDAVVLSSAAGLSSNVDSDFLNEIDVPDVTLNLGEFFFAGAIMNTGHGDTPGRLDDDGSDEPPGYPPSSHSYYAGAIGGVGLDPNDLDDNGPDLIPVAATQTNPQIGDGNWMLRPITPIPQGSCCFQDGTCVELIECDCQLMGGTYQGHGTTCATTVCAVGPNDGACCDPCGSCSEVSAGDCAAISGTFNGNGSTCAATVCNLTFATGACCLAGGSCQPTTLACCAISGGSYLGDGTQFDCAFNPCGCTLASCADGDGDDIRDDGCTWWECDSGTCVATSITYADMGGEFGDCAVDGAADANDRFHALNCFSNQTTLGVPGYPCEQAPPAAFNVDAAGLNAPCTPDGVCDGNDAFAALNAFEGTTPCSCPPGPAPTQPAEALRIEAVGVELRTRSETARPGDSVEVDIFLTSRLDDLRGYQLHLGVSVGRPNDLVLTDIAVVERDDHVFAGLAHWAAFNVGISQVLAGLDSLGVAAGPGAHLATFTYRVGPDASGTHAISVLGDPSDNTQRTAFFSTAPDTSLVAESATLVIEILDRQCKPGRRRR